MKNIPRFLRTTRHLRPSQVFWRARYLIERNSLLERARRPRPPAAVQVMPDYAAFPDVPLIEHSGLAGPEAVTMLDRGEIVHLNYRLKIGRLKPYWRLGNQQRDRLWVVTLHYHRWAYELAKNAAVANKNAPQAETLFKEYLANWMEDCDLEVPGARDLAWNGFAIATRTEWWVRSALILGRPWLDHNPDFRDRFLLSLWRQAAYLHTHPEKDLLANHFMRDALGLAWAGRFFQGTQARRWLAAAADIAREQAEEQVLPDGAHFELSPMYHLQVMEDITKLAFLLPQPDAAAAMRQAWARMAEYLRWVRHPDGQVPLFNDGALNASADPDYMFALAPQLGVPFDPALPRGGKLFPDAGLVAWHGDPWTVFFDAGPVGPDHQPGHAHADTLTLECSWRGQRLIVDPGTHSYDSDPVRDYDRSTMAHNTVGIDDQDSSEVWHIFRVGRRARPLGLDYNPGDNGFTAAASHDGYDFLTGRPRHRRSVTAAEDALIIVDRIEGDGEHRLEGGYLIEPSWMITPGPQGWTAESDAGRVRVTVTGPKGLRLAQVKRPYHPEYGLELSAPRLAWSIRSRLPVEVRTVIEEI